MKYTKRTIALILSALLCTGTIASPVWGEAVLPDASVTEEALVDASVSEEATVGEPEDTSIAEAAAVEEAPEPDTTEAALPESADAPAEPTAAAELTDAALPTAEEPTVAAEPTEAEPITTATSGTWNGLTWQLADSGRRLTVTGSGAMPDCADAPWRAAEIKDNVTEIRTGNYLSNVGAHAFSDFPAVKTVKIGSRFRSIDTGAFENCTELRTVNNTSTRLTTIGNSAFAGCENLNEAVLPSTLITIGKRAYADCGNLRRVVLPNEIETVKSEAFINCIGINHVYVPESLENVGDDIFRKCVGPMSVEIGSFHIGEGMFRECSGLNSLTIGDYVSGIGMYAFQDCIALRTLNIPEGVEVIGDSAFEGCLELNVANISEGVSTICTRAFYGTGIESLLLPTTLTYLGSRAFSACEDLTYVDLGGPLLTAIGDYAFARNYNLETVIFGGSIKTIGKYAFDHCTSLTDVTWPDSLEEIGNNAFAYNSELKTFVAGDAVTTIGDNAFYYCSGLENVSLGKGMETLGANAFAFCLDLTTFKAYSTGMEYKNRYVLRNAPVTIQGYKGSTSEAYANKYGYPFTTIVGLQRPVITTCTQARTGVSLKWKAVPNARNYTVYRATSRYGSYVKVAYTTSRAFLDTSVVSGRTYHYYIIADDQYMLSQESKISKVTIVLAPKSVGTTNSLKGVTLSWTAVPNAEKYIIYRKTTGDYQMLKAVTAPSGSKVTYTDPTAASGTIYRYAVAAYDNNVTGLKREARVYMRLTTPTITSVSSISAKTMIVCWLKINEARGYQIRYTTDPTFKTGVKTVTAGGTNTINKTITGLESGKTYYVRVLCYQKSGKYYYSGNSYKKKVTVK